MWLNIYMCISFSYINRHLTCYLSQPWPWWGSLHLRNIRFSKFVSDDICLVGRSCHLCWRVFLLEQMMLESTNSLELALIVTDIFLHEISRSWLDQAWCDEIVVYFSDNSIWCNIMRSIRALKKPRRFLGGDCSSVTVGSGKVVLPLQYGSSLQLMLSGMLCNPRT